MKKIIKNGTIATAADTYQADILIENEKIAMIGKDLPAEGAEIIDAKGAYIFPGALIRIPISICRLEGQRRRMIMKRVRLLLHMEARQRSSTFV